MASEAMLQADLKALAELPIDHKVGPSFLRGGHAAGRKTLESFMKSKLDRYGEDRNEPDVDGASGLSPYLHFGHVGAHEVWHELIVREKWKPSSLKKVNGSREGFWGMSPAAESFLDEVLTWRELGYNQCVARPTVYDQYEGLPDFAQKTLKDHAGDKRPHVYSRAELEQAQTHDKLWNAAQTQLVREGRMHNYLRMLWGKKVLEWSPTPRDALAHLIELNNKYALDGRNPNSYSGIFWVLGRFDRAWGPEREIFGKVRYMSSDNTARKLSVTKYLKRYQPEVKAALR
jgi:deoxyribodipyrimidine photo-lyase